jgi:hypothetical protein
MLVITVPHPEPRCHYLGRTATTALRYGSG